MAAIVLAAGGSTRFGNDRNKLIEDIGGKPMVAHAFDALRGAGIQSIFVVLGFEAEAVAEALSGRDYHAIRNHDWAAGMGTSIACGIRSLPQDRFEGALVLVADLPDIEPRPIQRTLDRFFAIDTVADVERSKRIIVPTHGGQRGHPVLFGAAYFPELGRLEGDRGGRGVMSKHPERVIEVEIDTDAILRDIDTVADLATTRAR